MVSRKQIISMATRMRVRDFSGGSEPGDANRYVTSRGFAIVKRGNEILQ